MSDKGLIVFLCKRFFCVLYVLYTHSLFSVDVSHSPLLVAVLIVKDEEPVIQETLQPLVQGGIDSFFILDTGSSDNTISVIRNFFVQHSIEHGYVEQQDFVDFSTSRNMALEKAQELFSGSAFMIMLDAEWYLHNVQGLIDFCRRCLLCGDLYPAYLIRILNHSIDFYVPRLIRTFSNVRFEGSVHETLFHQIQVKVPSDVFFEYRPTVDGMQKTYKRYKKDRELLYKEYYKNPSNRTLFYLGLTCEGLGNVHEAYSLYKKRLEFVNYDEEDFFVCYRLAQVIERLSVEEFLYNQEEAYYYYCLAHKMRPHRAEPLVKMSLHCLTQGRAEDAYFFARKAVAVPYPENDILFVQKHIYDIVRYEVLALCEKWVCENKKGHTLKSIPFFDV